MRPYSTVCICECMNEKEKLTCIRIFLLLQTRPPVFVLTSDAPQTQTLKTLYNTIKTMAYFTLIDRLLRFAIDSILPLFGQFHFEYESLDQT
jgi:hypothetical protein